MRDGIPSDGEVRAWCERALPGAKTGRVSALSGGLLNHVWRVEAGDEAVIVKHTPEFVASNPEIELSAVRGAFERAALEWAESLGTARARTPRVLGALDAPRVLVTEDLGDLDCLGDVLEDDARSARVCASLGRFISSVHASSWGDSELGARFDNADVQRVRRASQYSRVGDWLMAAGVEDARELGGRADALGLELTHRGVCVVMGDLWPASVLCDGADARVIDWEFAHFGRPCQDVGHLGAHLWLAAAGGAGEGAGRGWRAFVEEYARGVGERWGAAERRACATHFAAEVLTRTIGAFGGSVEWAPPVGVALERASRALRTGHERWFEGI